MKDIMSEECVGCQQCGDECPAVEFNGHYAHLDFKNCKKCDICKLIKFDCPGDAIIRR